MAIESTVLSGLFILLGVTKSDRRRKFTKLCVFVCVCVCVCLCLCLCFCVSMCYNHFWQALSADTFQQYDWPDLTEFFSISTQVCYFYFAFGFERVLSFLATEIDRFLGLC